MGKTVLFGPSDAVGFAGASGFIEVFQLLLNGVKFNHQIIPVPVPEGARGFRGFRAGYLDPGSWGPVLAVVDAPAVVLGAAIGTEFKPLAFLGVGGVQESL